MSLQSITLTAKQTKTYEGSDGQGADIRKQYRDRAQQLANETGSTVEVYAHSGYVLDAYEPESRPWADSE